MNLIAYTKCDLIGLALYILKGTHEDSVRMDLFIPFPLSLRTLEMLFTHE